MENNDNGEHTPENNIDIETIKAENLKLKRQIEQAEHTIVELKRKSPEISEDAISAVVEKKLNEAQTIQSKDIIDQVIASLGETEEEKKEILSVYDTKIVKSGLTQKDIINDLAIAKTIVKAKEIQAKSKEVAEAVRKQQSMQSSSPSSGGQFKDDTVSNENNWSDADKALLLRYGVDPNTNKPLKNN